MPVLLLLALVTTSAAQPAAKPKELWHSAKKSTELAIARLRKEAPKDSAERWWKAAKQPWDFAVKYEVAMDAICAEAERRVVAAEKSPTAREKRLAAVRTLRDYRKLAVYDVFVPTKIRELAEGDPIASVVDRLFTEKMTETEMRKKDDELLAETGFTRVDYAAMKRAVEEAAKPAKP